MDFWPRHAGGAGIRPDGEELTRLSIQWIDRKGANTKDGGRILVDSVADLEGDPVAG